MPKTDAERSRSYRGRKRVWARENGLCIVCCKQGTHPGLATCSHCSIAASERRKRRRQRARESAGIQHIVLAHEQAGDRAFEHHLYADAAQWYRKALSIEGIPLNDRLRIAEKLRRLYLVIGDPMAAARFIDWLLQTDQSFYDNYDKAAEATLQSARQFFLDLKTEQALLGVSNAAKIVETERFSNHWFRVNLMQVFYLRMLGRTDESRNLLATITEPGPEKTSWVRMVYHNEKAAAFVEKGDFAECCRSFEHARIEAKDNIDYTSVLDGQADAFWQLGDIQGAKTLLESAIFIGYEYQIPLSQSFTNASYCVLLATMGQYPLAREYFSRAMAYEVPSPSLGVLLTTIGIRLALQFKDDQLLRRCERPEFIARVFEDGSPQYVYPAAAMFARLFAFRGQHQRAQTLLHRALPYLTSFFQSWDLLLEIAKSGARADLPTAREFLKNRLSLPHSAVAQAVLSFFEALVAQRDKRLDATSTYASDAIRQFTALNWYGYADMVRSFVEIPIDIGPSIVARSSPALAGFELTRREREVAELVLRGLSNRAIAERLTIKERTVEAHMSSIMSRLGMRSRYQLIHQFTKSE